jgi:hypothetical protein
MECWQSLLFRGSKVTSVKLAEGPTTLLGATCPPTHEVPTGLVKENKIYCIGGLSARAQSPGPSLICEIGEQLPFIVTCSNISHRLR